MSMSDSKFIPTCLVGVRFVLYKHPTCLFFKVLFTYHLDLELLKILLLSQKTKQIILKT